PTRLVVTSKWLGSEVYDALEQCHISAEMQRANQVVFIVSPQNYTHLSALSACLNGLQTDGFTPYNSTPACKSCEVKKLLFNDNYSVIPLKDAVGRICYHEVGLYPPGTALAVSGEILSKAKVDLLINFSNLAFGLVNGGIAVVK
ncbi:MAG: hypothetical protein R3Y23_06670, partial [Bacillota bacterium]